MNIILIEKGDSFFPFSDERALHIKKILHLKEGESFRAGIINGDEGKATIESITEDGISFNFMSISDASMLYPITLIVGQTRPICMKRILREAVSLGVERIFLPITELGEKSYQGSSLYTSGEYKNILLDGAMQSGFTGVSETRLFSSVNEAIKEAEKVDVKLLLDNQIGAKKLSKMDLKGKSVVLAIGPERGWSNKERELFISSNYEPTLIGSRILRTETAVPSSVMLALSRMDLI